MALRYAIRVLLQGRGITLLAAAALALGIGANTAIFSVVRAVLLQSLPYREPDRLISILEPQSSPLGSADFADLRDQARSFESMGAAESWSAGLTRHDPPEQVNGMHVSEDLFHTLGVAPILGRVLMASDFAPGAPHTAVIGYRLWQRNFGGSTAAVGSRVIIDGDAYTIVGIMPAAFYFAPFWLTESEIWSPLQINPAMGNRGGGSLRVFARLRPGIGLRKAQTELNQIAASLAAAYPAFDAGLQLIAESLPEKAVGGVRPVLELMFAAVGMVLLIACANVANLSLARATARQKETALRLALGAGRARIARQFLLESLLLAMAGGGLGLLLARAGTALLQKILQPDADATRARLLQWNHVAIDTPVLLFTLALSIATGVLFGLAPAFAALRGDVNPTLKESGRGSSPRGGAKFRAGLVAAEIAIALVLAIGAALLGQSFQRLRAADPGFDPHNVVTMAISVAGRPDYVGVRRDALYREILDRISGSPGIVSASMINHLPIAGDRWGYGYWIEGRPLPAPGHVAIATYRSTRPNYFTTMRSVMLAGRDFNDRDTASAPAVAIVNQTLARQIGDAVGKRIAFNDPRNNPQWATIVGVVQDLAQSWATPPQAEVYVPYWQDTLLTASTKPFAAYMTLIARTNGDAETMIEPLKRNVWSVDPRLPLSHVQTLQQAVGNATWGPRFSLYVAGTFSGLALLLSVLGVYGMMSYEIAQRTREIGIRMAIGANARSIVAWIALHTFRVVAAGLALGLLAAACLAPLMRNLLYQVHALDLATFWVVAAVTTAAAALAAMVPTWRAMRVDPVIALRDE